MPPASRRQRRSVNRTEEKNVPRGNKKLKRLPYERCNSYLELMCQPLKLTFNYILQINGNRSVVPGPCLLARSGWLRKKYSPLRPHQSISVPAALGHRLPLHRRKGKGQLQPGLFIWTNYKSRGRDRGGGGRFFAFRLLALPTQFIKNSAKK